MQQTRPQDSGGDSEQQRDPDLGQQAVRQALGNSALLVAHSQKQSHGEHRKHVSPGRFQHESDPDRLLGFELLQNRQNHRAAGAAEHRADQKPVGPGQAQTFDHDHGDQNRAEYVSQRRQQKTSRKMPQGVAKVELQSAFEQHQNDGESSQQVRGLGECGGRLHQAEHRPEQNSQHHQDKHVGDSRESEDPVGQEGHDQQPADQSQN